MAKSAIQEMLDAAKQNDAFRFKNAFQLAMAEKTNAAIEQVKKDVGGSLFPSKDVK